MKKIIRSLRFAAPLFDILLIPLTVMAALWLRIAKYWGLKKMPLTNSLLLKIGLIPVVDHYYEPLFDYRKLPMTRRDQNNLPGLNMNIEEQLELIKTFTYQNELVKIPLEGRGLNYYYHNEAFQSGDAEVYYSLLRQLRPKLIIEVGSGFSTLLALEAIKINDEGENHKTNLICIEPYEMPMLESLPVTLIRKKIEDLEFDIFGRLNKNDILFIDSSHVIRPGGDVQFVILNLLPLLKKGVWIHFHDIFTPSDYPVQWLKEEYRLWNEQYLLEAFLCNNDSFAVMCSLNFLKNNYFEELKKGLPILGSEPERQPGSFWIRKI